MDAEASTGAVNNIELYYLKFSDAEFPTPYKQQRGSVIKYTKIPDYDLESRGKLCLCLFLFWTAFSR